VGKRLQTTPPVGHASVYTEQATEKERWQVLFKPIVQVLPSGCICVALMSCGPPLFALLTTSENRALAVCICQVRIVNLYSDLNGQNLTDWQPVVSG
jgi:hypothetical protein